MSEPIDPVRGSPEPTSRETELLWRYLDRINAEETVDPDEILREHPDTGPEIVRQLEAFQRLSSRTEADVPLGVLGDYTLRRQIGRGGMGVVYEAWENSMDRRVALKVLPAGIAADERAVARFVREAQLAGRLSHPNVVAVYGMGVKEQTPYYAMEYVEGETLAQVLAQIKDAGPEAVTPFGQKDSVVYFARVAEAFADVADGLQHAHSKKVIHRDIKPSNLILNREGRLRILDFGLARLEGQGSLTISGDLVGTPQYMSPEQARRKKIEVDHRTDVYSLGTTLYEALAGRPPFRGKDHADTLSQIIQQDPVEPRKVNPRVSKDLETIVLKCLRKEASDRYGTAEAMGQDLRRFVRGDPIEARPQTALQSLVKELRRRRSTMLLGGVLLALVGTFAWLAAERELADRQLALAAYEPAVLNVLKRLEVGKLSLAGGESTRSVVELSASRVRPVGREDIERLITDQDTRTLESLVQELTGIAETLPNARDARYHLARAYRFIGRIDEARWEAERVLEADPTFVPARVLLADLSDPAGAQTVTNVAATVGWQRWWVSAHESIKAMRWQEAVDATDRLIALARAEGEPYIGCLLEAYLKRGTAYLELRSFLAAQEDFIVAGHLCPGLESSLLLAKAYHLHGEKDGRDRAEAVFLELLAATSETDKARTILWIVAVYDSVEDFDMALSWTEKLGEGPLAKRLRCWFLGRLGHLTEAIEAGERAVALDPTNPRAHLALGFGLLKEVWSVPWSERGERVARLLVIGQRAAELAPDTPAARALLSVAELESSNMSRINKNKEAKPMKAKHAVVPSSFLAALALSVAGVGQEPGGRFEMVTSLAEINSAWWDRTPSVSSNGLTLYFDSLRPGGQGDRDLYMATRASTSEPFGNVLPVAELNSPYGECGLVVSSDGLTAFFSSTRPPGWMGAGENSENGEIWMASREGMADPWRNITNLQEFNTEYDDFHPHVSCDLQTLVYTSARPGGLGDVDLWLATRTIPTMEWSLVRNLDEINSATADWSGFVTCDGLTLFWQSLRSGGQGHSDIWAGRRESQSGRFSEVVNLGAPVNTGFWDGNPYVSADWPKPGSSLYFARADVLGDIDIYQATWVPIPIAHIHVEGPDADGTVIVDGTQSTAPHDSGPLSFEWNFGDAATASGATATHHYSQAGRYSVTLTVTNSLGYSATATRLIVVAWPMTDLHPWLQLDVGSPAFHGGARRESGTEGPCFQICAGGDDFLTGSSDQFHFVHREFTGSAVLTARVTEFTGHPVSAVGLMFREDRPPAEADGAAYASLLLVKSGSGRVWFLRRESFGQPTESGSQSLETFTVPAWIRLERAGGEIVGFYATVDPPSEADWKVLQRVPDFLPDQTPILGGIAANGKDPGAEAPFVALEAAVCIIESAIPPRFLRADANGDATIDLSDAIATLSSLFAGGTPLYCLDAADVNDSGLIDISDAIYTLNHLFLGASAPPEPFAECGLDPTEDGLSCESIRPCA